MKRIATQFFAISILISFILAPINPAATHRTLGDTYNASSQDSPASPFYEAAAVSAGGSHTCAIVSGGGVMCWGWNGYGQLGNNSTTSSLVPVEVSNLVGATAISAGEGHTCALITGGAVKCWGYNAFGQVGDGSNTDRLVPVIVSGLESGVTAISAGETHTCALLTGGTVRCWGYNSNGQLGDGSTTDRWTPVPVSGLGGPATVISAGLRFTCARLITGGVQCWGHNSEGELGDGSFDQHNTPVGVAGLDSGMASVSAGNLHTCALTTGGAAKCWGHNLHGELGDNSTTIRNTPVDVFGLGSGIAAISAGAVHTCALTTGSGVKCWGDNYYGQVGDGTGTQRLIPTDVVGLSLGVASVEAGESHTCGLTGEGGLMCWGENFHGQLGDGSGYIQSIPVDVVGFETGLRVSHIEVTQVTQDQNNMVPLIAHKPTMVRVYLQCGLSCASLPPLTGTLIISSARGSDSQSSSNRLASIAHTNDWRILRGNLSRTLNFTIQRSELLEGDVSLTVQVNGVNASLTLPFIRANKLRVYWTDIRYQQGDQVFSPDFGVASTGSSDLQKMYPLGMGDLEYTYQPGDIPVVTAKFTCDGSICPAKNYYIKELNRLWDRLSRTDGWAGGAAPDRLYGWVPNAAREMTKTCGISDPLWAALPFDPLFDIGKGRVAAGADGENGFCDKPFGMQLTPARVLAHELAHDLDKAGIKHTPNLSHSDDNPRCFAKPDGPGSYPNPNGLLDEFGVDVTGPWLFTPTNTHDFMSYCTPTWASRTNYMRLVSVLTSPPSRLTAPDVPTPQLLVSGVVISPSLQVDLDPSYQVTSEIPPDPLKDGDWCLELRGSGAELLDQRCFNLAFRDPEEGTPILEDSFSLAIPFPPETARIELSHLGVQVLERVVTAHPPAVTLTQPNGGEVLGSTGIYTATWTASDPDSSVSAYSLEYSRDNGTSWVPLGIDLTEPQLAFDLARLGGGDAVLLRAGASDGVLTGYDTSDSALTVGKKAPQVAIAALEGGNFRSPEAPVYMQGYAFDLEDGTLPDAALIWSSSLDGDVGTGSQLLVELSPGLHIITLSATDSDGNISSDSTQIFVGYKVFLPITR